MVASGTLDTPMLERMIRLSLITGKDNMFIERFKELVKTMIVSQVNLYSTDGGEFVCYEPNGENLEKWAFYLNESDNVIYINESFWVKYNNGFDLVNLEEIYVYFRTLILAHFNLEKFFDNPRVHISMHDDVISSTLI